MFQQELLETGYSIFNDNILPVMGDVQVDGISILQFSNAIENVIGLNRFYRIYFVSDNLL